MFFQKGKRKANSTIQVIDASTKCNRRLPLPSPLTNIPGSGKELEVKSEGDEHNDNETTCVDSDDSIDDEYEDGIEVRAATPKSCFPPSRT